VAYPDLVGRLLPAGRPSGRRDVVNAVAGRLLPGTPLARPQADALVAFLGGDGPMRDWQWTGGDFRLLVALVMDSPQWSAR
jgi:hypothetical protein